MHYPEVSLPLLLILDYVAATKLLKTTWRLKSITQSAQSYVSRNPGQAASCFYQCSKNEVVHISVGIDDATNHCSCNLLINAKVVYLVDKYYQFGASMLFIADLSEIKKFRAAWREQTGGEAMLFTEPGPSSMPSQKFLLIQASSNRYLKYEVPGTFRDIILEKGLIITFWLKVNSNSFATILSFNDEKSQEKGSLYASGGTKLTVRGFFMGGSLVSSANAFELNVWKHMALVFRNSTARTDFITNNTSKRYYVSVQQKIATTRI